MKILITGAAGFIGYSLADYLLKKKIKIYGLDNFDGTLPIDKTKTIKIEVQTFFFTFN